MCSRCPRHGGRHAQATAPRGRAPAPLGTAAWLLLAFALPLAAAGEGDRRDPLRPPDYREPEPTVERFDASAWRLASTLVSDDRRIAVINGQAVRAGDYVGGARVLEIESGRVALDYRGRRFDVRRATAEVRRETRP